MVIAIAAMIVVSISATIVAAIAAMKVVSISATKVVAIGIEATVAVTIEENYRAAIANIAFATVIPISRNPVAIVVVACDPYVTWSRARRNVGPRPTHNNPHFGCVGRGRSKAQPASQYRCTQHKFAKAFHDSSVLLLKPTAAGLGSLALAASCRAAHVEYKHSG
jgi:hypothetical protein